MGNTQAEVVFTTSTGLVLEVTESTEVGLTHKDSPLGIVTIVCRKPEHCMVACRDGHIIESKDIEFALGYSRRV